MKRMHFSNGKLNPRFQVVAWNSGAFGIHPPDSANGSEFAEAALSVGGQGDGTSFHEGERYDWNRSACLAPALYVRRHGAADPDFRHGVRLADANRYLSEHQHPRHQRGFQLHGPACRRHGRPHRHVLRAVAAQQRQRHRAYRIPIDRQLRDHQDLLSADREHQRRAGAGQRHVADRAEADAAGHHAAVDPELQCLERADSAACPFKRPDVRNPDLR